MLPTPAVSAGRSEEPPAFQETEYVNEDDEDGGLKVNLLSFDGMPVRLVSPGKIAASWSGSKRFDSPKWTAPSMPPASFESSSRTGAPSTASAQFGKVLQSITHKTPVQSRETSENVVPSERAVKKQKQPTVDGGSAMKTVTGIVFFFTGRQEQHMALEKNMPTDVSASYMAILLNFLQILIADRRNNIAASDLADPQHTEKTGMIRVL